MKIQFLGFLPIVIIFIWSFIPFNLEYSYYPELKSLLRFLFFGIIVIIGILIGISGFYK